MHGGWVPALLVIIGRDLSKPAVAVGIY